MKIILFRHGPAGERDSSRWPDDGERPLTSRGEQRTRLAALGLRRIERNVDRILTSPFKRAERTAKILGQVLEMDGIEALDALVPGGSQAKIVEAVTAHPRARTVILVGHEPDLGMLAGHLLFKSQSPIPLKKAGACAIAFDGPVRAGTGGLEWLATPRLLRRFRRRKAAV
ncbi:MAG TPA: phosphohistidine phosphatase SixA [Candidatus Eisenbacteria bacterium]|jgi:phosphohistidine phosphatase